MSGHIIFTKNETNNLGVEFYRIVTVTENGQQVPFGGGIKIESQETAELRTALNEASEETGLPIASNVLECIEAHEEKHGLVNGRYVVDADIADTI